jgi:hypothetical protein
MRLVELILNEAEGFTGVEAISVVDKPAIEEDFIVLNSHEYDTKLSEIDPERRLFIGAVLIPEKPILRLDENKEPYHIFFSKDTVSQTAHNYIKRGMQGNTTLQHAVPVEGVTVVESWLVEDSEKDKSAIYGKSYPVGTWVAMQKIDNDEIYKQAKEGKIKGFSIEGLFSQKTELKKELSEEDKLNKIIEILNG